MGEGIDEIAVGVLYEALQRYRAAGGITDQALHLVAPMGGDMGVGVERKAPHAGTAETGESGRLTRMVTSCADAPDLLTGPLPAGDTLLHGSRHNTGEFGSVVGQGIIACGHGCPRVCLQVSQVAQLTDDPPTDLLDHVSCSAGADGGDVNVSRWLAWDKTWREALVSAIQIDALKKDDMAMEIGD
jgi:hypothetical protein